VPGLLRDHALGVAGVARRIQAGRARGPLHDPGDRAIAEAPGQLPAVAVHRADESRPRDRARREPGPDRAHRAGRRRRAERDADVAPLALLVRLRPADGDDQAVGRLPHVGDVEPDQLGAADGAGEAEQQERPIPDTQD
jgi:hypothetical protein